MKVSIIKDNEFEATIKALELIKDEIIDSLKGKKNILIKPNLVVPKKREIADTNVNVVRAIITFLNKIGEFKITVAEGVTTAFGSTKDAFKENGYFELENEFNNVELKDLDEDPIGDYFEGLTLYGKIRMGVYKTAIDSDYIISAAKLKTHNHVPVTLSLKNMMGCLNQSFRSTMHGGIDPGFVQLDDEIYKRESILLHHNLIKLSEFIYPDLAVIDGVLAMEGNGPASHDKVELGVVIASKDPLSADIVACKLMEINPDDIAYLKILKDKRKPEIKTVGENIEKIKRKFRLHERFMLQFVTSDDVYKLLSD